MRLDSGAKRYRFIEDEERAVLADVVPMESNSLAPASEATDAEGDFPAPGDASQETGAKPDRPLL